MDAEGEYLTPPQIAKLLKISKEKVLLFIAVGELKAFDLSKPGSKRPRYRVPESELEAFLQSRIRFPRPAKTETRKPPRKKRKFYP